VSLAALSADEFAALANIKALEALTLSRTNVTDTDLRHLRGLAHLRAVALNSTEITDAAIDELAMLPALKSLCLGSVNITPAGVARLKMRFQAEGRKLSLGYTQRQPPANDAP
jgi:hypothetical protein